VLAQPALDALFRAPAWVGWALVALAAALVALGRHGARLLLAVLCGPLLAWLAAEAGIAPPGALLWVALGAGAAAGAVLPGWTRSLLFAGLGWVLGAALARRLGVAPLAGAAVGAPVAFLGSYFNDRMAAVLVT